MPDWTHIPAFSLSDPVVQKLVAGAVALIVLVIVLRLLGRLREGRSAARRRAALRRQYESVRLQQEEVKHLADQILATSSTSRIAGYAIIRQVETVFGESRPSSAAALDQAKALAAQKGANAIINLQIQQVSSGKWVASGDGVIARLVGRPESPPSKPA